jgi:hypothetical protein
LIRCSRFRASAISFVVTEPKVFPCSPAFSVKMSVTAESFFASASASPCARSCFAWTLARSCATRFS